MKNLFDDFLRELNERQAGAQGGPTRRDTGGTDPADDDGPETTDADTITTNADADIPDTDVEAAANDKDDADAAAADADDAGADADTDADEAPDDEPIMIRPRDGGASGGGGSRGGGKPPRRPPGGPDDGGSFRQRLGALGPQVLLAVIGLILFAAVFLIGIGLDLATDAIWFDSVGFDPVFWTRLGSQVGLFAVGLLAALVFLFANLWLAGRLAPPPDATSPSGRWGRSSAAQARSSCAASSKGTSCTSR